MTPPPSPGAPARRRWGPGPRALFWVVALTGFGFCALLAALHIQQRAAFAQEFEEARRFRQARLDLADGFVHVLHTNVPGAPYDRAQGLALVGQAVRSFGDASDVPGAEPERLALAADAERFRARLAGWHGAGEPKAEVELRIGYHRLATRAARIDAESQSRLGQLAQRHAAFFSAVMGVAAVFLALLLGTVILTDRAVRREEAARRRAEDRDRRSAELLGAVVSGTTDAMFVKDRDGKYLLFNDAAGRFVGKPAAEVIGKDDTALFDPAGARVVMDRDRAVMAAGAVDTTEEELTAQDGTTRTYLATKLPYRDGAGNVIGVMGISRDITELKDTERQLRAERDRFAKIVETVPAVILSFRLRPDGTSCFPYASPRLQELYGLGPEAVRDDGSPVFATVHPDDIERVRATITESARAMTPWRADYRAAHPTRGEIWIEGHSVPVRDPDGGTTWHGSVADVTERRRAEQALRESESRLAEAQRVARMGSWRWVPATGAVWWSDAIYELFGLSRDTVPPGLGAFLEQLHPDDRPRAVRRVEAVLAGADGFDDELQLLRPDGEVKWIRSLARVTRDSTGQLLRVDGFDQDITARKVAEAAIRESEAQFRATFEQAAVGVSHVAPDGRFLRVNGRFAETVGFTREELLATAFQTITHPDDLTTDLDLVAQLLAGTIPHYSLEKRYVRKTGEPVWVNLTVSLRRGASGEPLHFISVVEDISARKRAEMELRAEQERLQLALAAGLGIWEWNVVTDAVHWSPETFAVMGMTENEFGGGKDDFARLVHPDDQPGLWEKVALTLADGGPPFEHEFRVVRPDGALRWLMNRGKLVRDAEGRGVRLVGVVADITARKEADAALRESEERFRAVFDHATDGIFLQAADGQVVDANRAACQSLGYAREELIGTTPADFNPTVTAATSAALGARLAAGELVAFDTVHRRKDGTTFPVEVRVRPFMIGDRPFGVAVARDITERKRAEQELRDSERRFRNLVHALPDAVFVNAGGRLAFCNSACVRLFGATDATQLFGKSPLDLFHPDFHPVIESRIESMHTSGAAAPGSEEKIVRLDGAVVPVYVTALPVVDGGAPAILVVLHDLTERKRVEMQLRHQEMMIREAGELARVGGWGFDPATGEGDWTPETARIHGVSPATDMVVADGLSRFAGEHRVRLEAAVADAVARGTPYDLELLMTAADGEQKWVRTICRPIVEGGKVVRVRGSLQDITERKRAELEIRQLNADLEQRVRDRTAELEAANKELESFSYSVSHDLRAPIRHITGFTGIVLGTTDPPLPEEARGHLQRVAEAAQRMGQLVDDLLALSRLGRQKLVRQPVNTQQLVEECLHEVLNSYPERRPEVRVGALPSCTGDRNLLRQVWLNLLGNAVKYSGKRDAPALEVGAADAPDGPAYFVRDNGVGFDMRYAHKLFGVFQRLHRREEFEGTGVGLAIVQRIVQRHDGRVWAEAEPGRGATFWFTLGSR